MGDSMPSATITTETTTLVTRGIECVLHKWNPTSAEPVAVAVVYHGFAAHARYPTVRYASELFAKNGFTVFALDLPGHGSSPGVRGLLSGVDSLLDDALAVATHAKKMHMKPELPLFLVGSSMGGAIALGVSKRLPVTGVVMLAPMLSLKVSYLERKALGALSWLFPTNALIPSSATDSERQYRDPEKRAHADADPLTYKGKLRSQSAYTCVELAVQTRESFTEVNCPFLCLVAIEDVVVDNSAVEDLMELSPSTDKKLKKYDALHGLLCEPQPLLGVIESDIMEWMLPRAQKCQLS